MNDTISIGAIFSDGHSIFLYDQAYGRIVAYDTKGAQILAVTLEAKGRATFGADDFVVSNNRALLLNAVDRRIEIFDMSNGKHLTFITIAHNPLVGEGKRLYLLINRIYLCNNRIGLGNEHRIFFIDQAGSVLLDDSILRAPKGNRFIGIDNGHPIVIAEQQLRSQLLRKVNAEETLPVNGKPIAVINGKPYALVLTRRGFSIVSLR